MSEDTRIECCNGIPLFAHLLLERDKEYPDLLKPVLSQYQCRKAGLITEHVDGRRTCELLPDLPKNTVLVIMMDDDGKFSACRPEDAMLTLEGRSHEAPV